MGAFLEKVTDGVYVLRAGPKAFAYSDPYTASGTVVIIGAGVAEIRGFTRQSDDASGSLAMLHDIIRCLKDAGFKAIRWDRYKSQSCRAGPTRAI
jgi:hypothetical protein